MGFSDEPSYVWSAEVLARTGHLVYNGWATAMLGWQLYLAAAFFHLFGYGFGQARATTVVVAVLGSWLLQRTLVRTGASEWNATLGALTVIFSPLVFALSFTFMTDANGLFCIVLCLYSCLRALQARTGGRALAWLVFAALSNAAGGTVRQIAWLGVLVMVPCAIWLLRRDRRLVLGGAAAWVCSVGIIFWSLHWFKQQPYSVPESLIPDRITAGAIANMVGGMAELLWELPLFLLPILLAFVGGLRKGNRRTAIFLTVGLLLLVAKSFVPHFSLLEPTSTDWFTVHGFFDVSHPMGSRPILFGRTVRILITAVVMVSVVSFLALAFTLKRKAPTAEAPEGDTSMTALLVLIVPFLAAYLGLLLPRAAFGGLFDRYLIPLIALSVVLLLRFYRDWVGGRLPAYSVAAVVLVALFSVAGLHDAFAMYRARQTAVDELRARGVPRTSISGTFGYDIWTQLEQTGHLNDHRVVNPPNTYLDIHRLQMPSNCKLQSADWSFTLVSPSVQPLYRLSYDPNACEGLASVPPVSYRDWLPPFHVTLYVVRSPRILEEFPSAVGPGEAASASSR